MHMRVHSIPLSVPALKQVLIGCPQQRSAIAAWLDAPNSSASVRLGESVQPRCAQLLGHLSASGLFRPLTYVHWLVAHGRLAAAIDSPEKVKRAAWHRCDSGVCAKTWMTRCLGHNSRD